MATEVFSSPHYVNSEIVYSVELHEEAQRPQIVSLVILHGPVTHDVLLLAREGHAHPLK